ncbi:MAG: hypothetical protein ACC662_01985, partial [Planctomycetota bacterium]
MGLPADVRRIFRAWGREGGRARAARLSAPDRRRIARQAAIARWTRERFGAATFEELGLPGGALVDRGLRDAAAGLESVESLLVALARARLRREGVPVPENRVPEPEERLFRRLEAGQGALAHARYRALRRQIVSF